MLQSSRKARKEWGQFFGGQSVHVPPTHGGWVAKQSISLNAQQRKEARWPQEEGFLTVLGSPRKPDLNKAPPMTLPRPQQHFSWNWKTAEHAGLVSPFCSYDSLLLVSRPQGWGLQFGFSLIYPSTEPSMEFN